MNKDRAEEIALLALAWLAASEDLMGVFLGSTGSSAQDIHEQAADPAFLGSVLDFLLMDDAWIIGFCDEQQLGYQQPMLARQHLPGGEIPAWT